MFKLTPTPNIFSIAKLLSSAIIVLGLFSFAPTLNTSHAALVKNQTEQLFSKQGDKVNYFYPPSIAPTQSTNHIIFNSILSSFNSKVDQQYLRDKIYAHSVDQRINLQLSIPNHFGRETHSLS